jgi:hypothetical protein
VHNNKKKSWFFKLSVLHLLLAAAAAHMGKHQSASQTPTPSSQKEKKRPLYKASLRNLVLAYTRAFKS